MIYTPQSKIDGYKERGCWVDLEVTGAFSEGTWDLELGGKNLTDELITAHAIDASLGGTVELYAPPRTYGATFNYYWN